jgi:hypothetical protein
MAPLPQTLAETHALLIERFGPALFHGSAASPAQIDSWLACEGLRPQNGSDFVWLGSRAVAENYCVERIHGRTGVEGVLFRIDLHQLDPALLRSDEQLGYHDHYTRLAAAQPFMGEADAEEEWRYGIYEAVSDTIAADPDFHAASNVFRSYAETGNLAYAGNVPATALSLAT